MQTTVKNYAAQARRSILLTADNLERSGDRDAAADDIVFMRSVAAIIDESIHFVLPDGGVVFNDRHKGLDGIEVRLPFQSITIEYENAHAKEVVFASELENDILVGCMSCIKDVWMLSPRVEKLPFDAHIGERPKTLETRVGAPFMEKWITENMSEDERDYYLHLPMDGVVSLEELLEALSCTNVHHSPINKVDAGKNARRVRDGKLPIYETRFLWIDAPGNRSGGAAIGSVDRSGPRQHLRRGHIRRLAGGKRTWVNSCVVGSPALGSIEKSYGIRNAT